MTFKRTSNLMQVNV